MAWLRRKSEEERAREAAEHAAPAEVDLGMQKEWEVQMEIDRLKSAGLSVYLVAQKEIPELGEIGPKHCRVYVGVDDELRVRAELASAGFL